MSELVLWIDNSMIAELDSLTHSEDGAYVNDATVQMTLYQQDGTTEVVGQAWPLQLVNVAATGKYQGDLDSDLQLFLNHRYRAKLTAVDVGGAKLSLDCWAIAKSRCSASNALCAA